MPAAPVEAAPAVEATAEPVEEDEETKAGRHGGHRRR
jgi:hypothetical protein